MTELTFGDTIVPTIGTLTSIHLTTTNTADAVDYTFPEPIPLQAGDTIRWSMPFTVGNEDYVLAPPALFDIDYVHAPPPEELGADGLPEPPRWQPAPEPATTQPTIPITSYELEAARQRLTAERAVDETFHDMMTSMRRVPIWITREGRRIYDAGEITNDHLINIYRYVVRRQMVPSQWMIDELFRRGINVPEVQINSPVPPGGGTTQPEAVGNVIGGLGAPAPTDIFGFSGDEGG